MDIKEEANTWINSLKQCIKDNFSEKEIKEITNGEEIGQSYCFIPSENAKFGASMYKAFFASQNVTMIKAKGTVEEDRVGNY
eukprot:146805-Ditylum_brightwellii.AAC.1